MRQEENISVALDKKPDTNFVEKTTEKLSSFDEDFKNWFLGLERKDALSRLELSRKNNALTTYPLFFSNDMMMVEFGIDLHRFLRSSLANRQFCSKFDGVFKHVNNFLVEQDLLGLDAEIYKFRDKLTYERLIAGEKIERFNLSNSFGEVEEQLEELKSLLKKEKPRLKDLEITRYQFGNTTSIWVPVLLKESINKLIKLREKLTDPLRGYIYKQCSNYVHEAHNLLTKHKVIAFCEELSRFVDVRHKEVLAAYIKDLNSETVKEIKLSPFGNIRLKDLLKDDSAYEVVTNCPSLFNDLIEELNQKINDLLPTTVSSDVVSKEWGSLGQLKLESLTDLVAPTAESPDFVQVIQAFSYLGRVSNDPMFKTTCRHFMQFLHDYKYPPDMGLGNIVDIYVCHRFKIWSIDILLETENVTVGYVNRMIYAVNAFTSFLGDLAPRLRSIEPVTGLIEGKSERTTDLRKLFSSEERKHLFKAMDAELKWARETIYSKKPSKNSKSEWVDLMRILQNDFAGCDLSYLSSQEVREKASDRFKKTARTLGFTPYYDVFDELKVLTAFNARKIVTILIWQMARLTGLNAEALADLTLDSYVKEDEISGHPVIRYWKLRSGGAKELFLPLFDSEIREVDTEIAEEIEELFRDAIAVSSKFRALAEEGNKEFLFLMYSPDSLGKHPVYKLNSESGHTTYRKAIEYFSAKYPLMSDDGNELRITISRFRPTLVSTMLEQGKDFRTIQHVLGHRSLETTMKYLEIHDFKHKANAETYKHLKKIHDIAIEVRPNKHFPERVEDDDGRYVDTSVCKCKNVFNPPDWIKASKSYVEGEACGQFNKCLICENGVVSVSNLPSLFSKKRSLEKLVSLESVSSSMDRKGSILEQLEILDNVLDYKLSEFSKEELEEAEKVSLYESMECYDPFGI